MWWSLLALTSQGISLPKSCLMRTKRQMKSNWRQSPLLALAGWVRQPSPKQFMTRSKPGLILYLLSRWSKSRFEQKFWRTYFYGLDKQKFEDIHDTTRDEKLLIDQFNEFLIDKKYVHGLLTFYFIAKGIKLLVNVVSSSSSVIPLVDCSFFFPFFILLLFLASKMLIIDYLYHGFLKFL